MTEFVCETNLTELRKYGILKTVPKPKHIPIAAIGGLIATAVYVATDFWGANIFLSNFLATLTCVIYANIFARVLKTPSIVFITASIIPLVPGLTVFRTMDSCLFGDVSAFAEGLVTTIKIGGAIALGLIFMSAFFRLVRSAPAILKSKVKE